MNKFFVFVACLLIFAHSFAQSGIEAIKQKAEAGDPSAMNTMGNIYKNGSAGQERDILAAKRWYEKAAEANYPAAYFNIGLMYERGLINGSPDLIKAEEMYKKASSLGFAKADEAMARIKSATQPEVPTCTMDLWHELMLSDATSSLLRKNLSPDPDLKKLKTDSSTKASLWTDLYDCTLINKGGVFGYVYNLKVKRVPVEKRVNDPESFLIMAVGGIQAIEAQNKSGGSVCYQARYTTRNGSPLKEWGGVRVEMKRGMPFPKSDDSCAE